MDLKALARSLSSKERELSRLARELIEQGEDGEAGELAWFALVEQAVMILRRGARDLEEAEGASDAVPSAAAEPVAASKDPPATTPEVVQEETPQKQKPRRPARKLRAKSPSAEVISGHASVIPVSEILGFLSGIGKSGVLWVETEREGFLVQLESGSVIYAQGDTPPKGQRLGEILVRHGAISTATLELAIERAASEHEVLGAWLMRDEQITSGDLSRALSEQAQQIFHRMFSAEDASYQFEDGLRIVESEDVRLNVIQLLLESARAEDEARSLFQAEFGLPLGRPSGKAGGASSLGAA